VNTVELAPYLSLGAPGSVIPTALNPQGLPNGTCVLGTESTCVNANVRPYIAGFRSADAVVVGPSTVPGLEILQLQGAEKTNEDSFFIRSDWKVNDKNSVYFRYFQDKGTDTTPEGVSGRTVLVNAEPRNFVGAWSSLFGNFINEFRVGYNAAKTAINGQAPTVNGIDFSNISLNVSGTTALLPSNTDRRSGTVGRYFGPGWFGACEQCDQRTRASLTIRTHFHSSITSRGRLATTLQSSALRSDSSNEDRSSRRYDLHVLEFQQLPDQLSSSRSNTSATLSDVSPFTGVSGRANALLGVLTYVFARTMASSSRSLF
jgi:hypothetical protein